MNYGAIGTVLGHELTHGFDNSGRQFDSTGNMRQWWTNETIGEYMEKTQCFVDHYDSYYEEEVWLLILYNACVVKIESSIDAGGRLHRR